MNRGFKLNIATTCILVILFASVAKAQLASDKSITEIYNKRISEKLAEKNKSKNLLKPFQKEPNLPSARSSLKDVAKLTIKNPEIISHNNSIRSHEKEKNKLPSNSSKLKQTGTQPTKSPTLLLQ
jgi:hypothetical protein